MAKRLILKIGDVFCVEFDEGYRCYFQYLCIDKEMLGSHVIRVFRTHYPLDDTPEIYNIVKDDVLFYAHTLIKIGFSLNAWYKVGNCTDTEDIQLNDQLFGYCLRTMLQNNKVVFANRLEHWMAWHIGEIPMHVGKLPKKYQDCIEYGVVIPYTQIIQRIRSGYYTATNPMYSLVKRRPLPDADSYCRRENDGVVCYYHFHGENLVREVIVDGGVSYRLSAQEPICDRYSLDGIKFWDINWKYQEFITEEEFEQAWK